MTDRRPAKNKKKRKKKHNPITDWLLYALVRIVVVFLFILGVDASLAIARFLGRQLWSLYHRGRERAIENLRASFPDKDQQWCRQVGRRSFEQIVMLTVDVLFTPRLVNRYNWRLYSRYKHIELPKWMVHGKQGILMVTGHYGNFEIVGYLFGIFGFQNFSIARPLDNKYLNRWLYGVRRRVGQVLIDKRGAADAMAKISAEGGTLCFIADQDAGGKGVFVDFFGRKASTYKSIGLLAITYNLPIAIGYSRRLGNRFFFEIARTRMILPAEWADKDDPLRWVTAEYTKEIEKFVRQDPTQYWWLHRRWKTRPKEELLVQPQQSVSQPQPATHVIDSVPAAQTNRPQTNPVSTR